MICFGRKCSGLEVEIAAADAGRSGQSARGVVRGLHAQLARRVGVEQVIAQDAILDDDGAPRRQSFAVKRRCAESAGAGGQQHDVVVDDGQAGVGDLLAQLAGEKRSAAPDGVAGSGFKDGADQRARNFGRKDDGHAAAWARAARPDGAACVVLLLFRRLQGIRGARSCARAAPPAIALHLCRWRPWPAARRKRRHSWCDSCP